MKAQSTSVTGVAASQPILLDANGGGAEVGYFVRPGAGATVSVELTPDDVMDPTVTPVWYAAPLAALVGATSNVAGGLSVPARAARLNQTVGATTSVLQVMTQSIR